MIQFPNHEETIAKTGEVLREQFAFANRLYNYWIRSEKDRYIQRCPLDDLVVNVAMTLNIQACRQYRSVIELCERCEGHDASVISRSLFETALAFVFLLTPDLYMRVVPVKGKPGAWRASLPPKGRKRKKDLLSRTLRAALYLASTAFNDEHRYNKWSTTHGRKRYAKLVKPDPKVIAACEREVGPEWAYILRNPPRTYSDLHLSDLVKGLGKRLDIYHDTVYHFQSRMTHASDVIRHATEVNGRLSPQWMSPVNEVCGALETGTMAFLVCLSLLQDEIDFGAHIGVDSFRKEFIKVFAIPK